MGKADINTLKTYLTEITKYPLLKPYEEKELLKHFAATGDSRTRERLVKHNLRLVVSIAKKYRTKAEAKGISFLDLVQEGSGGLVQAIEKFDLGKDCRLSTYATWWIRQGITRAIQNGDTIRIPVHAGEKRALIAKTASILAQELGRAPTREEIAVRLDMPLEDVNNLLANTRKTYSLDAKVSNKDDRSELGDFVASDTPSDLDNIGKQETFQRIRELVDEILPPRKAEIIKLYYGLGTDNPISSTEIARIYGVSASRARSIISSSVRTLKIHADRAAAVGQIDASEYGSKHPVIVNVNRPSKQLAQLPPPVPVEPKPQTSADLSQPQTPQEKPMTARQRKAIETQAAVRQALAEMIEAGEALTQRELCELAGANKNYLSENLGMRAEYHAAIEQIKQRVYGGQPDTALLQSRVQELEAALEQESTAKEALQRVLTEQQESAKETIQGLRKQLLEQGNRLSRLEEQRPAAKLDNRGLLEALQELAAQEQRTIDRCTSDLQALQDQIEQTRRDRAAAERHLDTFNAQIERLEEQVEVKASTNGHHKVAAGV